ncbi:MAG: amidase [Hyphomicrobiaceae bacterium]
MKRTPTLNDLATALADGKTTAVKLVSECLERIDDAGGEGRTAFIHVSRAEALAAAEAMDKLRSAGAAPSPFAGIPVSIKDLFDIRGEVTRAGSTALDDRAPAAADAPAVARLRKAGFVIIGRTNMTEFAFSGLGLNPHYGTPKCPFERNIGRAPGGSSAGAAISVTDGMAHMGLGTDTGGSCRIPAAFSGTVGFKPTARRVPTAGAIPLSTTLDSIGPLARTVSCCAIGDAVLAGEPQRTLRPRDARRLKLAVPQNFVLADQDEHVAKHFQRALKTLSSAGILIEDLSVPEFDDLPRINAKGGFAPPEALAWHRELIARRGKEYDPRVLVRIERGKEQSAVDYIELAETRLKLIEAVARRLEPYDAFVLPTTPIIAPRIEDLATDPEYARINVLALRNPSVINVLDGCAISIPMHRDGEPPTGLMLAAMAGSDHRLFDIAASVEALLDAAD